MDFMQMATQLLSDKLGTRFDADKLSSALGSLLGDGEGNIDIAGLASRFASSGEFGGVLQSWLGDGANAPISADAILDIFGTGKVADFASEVGTDTATAASSLSDVIPQLLDKSSSGGSLLESLGGASGLMGMARSFLR